MSYCHILRVFCLKEALKDGLFVIIHPADKAVMSCQSLFHFITVDFVRISRTFILENDIRLRKFPMKDRGCRGGIEEEGLSEMEILGSGLVGGAQNEG